MDEDPDYTELIEEYKRSGEFPLIWQWTARDMICAANVLHHKREAVQERRAEAAPELRFHTTPAPVMLLYGLALEILLKGLLVAQGVSATSTGELNAKLKTHNLLHLWREAGLPVDGQSEDLLRRLHWSVETGKYPVGTKPDPKAPSAVWVALTSVASIGSLLETVEDALRARQPKGLFEGTQLLRLCVE